MSNRINTGISLPRGHLSKLDRMAAALGVSRNKTLALIIEAAQEPEPKPALVVGKINNRNTQNFQAQGVTVVSA